MAVKPGLSRSSRGLQEEELPEVEPVACGAVSPNCSIWAQQTLSVSGYFNRNMFMHFM